MIEVILLERIDRLGPLGHVVKVRPGFARNFLLPQNKALRATKANMEVFEKQRAELEAKNANHREKAEIAGKKLENIKLVLIRQASEGGQLYGSVTARDVADAARDAGHPVERQHVYIDTPIKELGLYPVKVKLHPEVTVKVVVNIARSQDEALMQVEKQNAKTKADSVAAEAAAEKASVEAIGQQPVPVAEGEAIEAAEEASEPKKAKKPRVKKDAAEA